MYNTCLIGIECKSQIEYQIDKSWKGIILEVDIKKKQHMKMHITNPSTQCLAIEFSWQSKHHFTSPKWEVGDQQ